ncbi:S1/P1 nuclease [Flavobacteriaceae bacterium F08102]|nr:S1/P1 nuclease [Flavobacteriaceae bacterium F08102]
MKLTLSILFYTLIPTTMFANTDVDWGQIGHRATGQIAENHLSKKVLRKINKILKGERLALVSTFADEIKSDKATYGKFYTWHYINMDLDETYKRTTKNPKGDLVTGINTCIRILKDKHSSAEDKNLYLKLLIHFIGDLHQPLHLGRPEDQGGNTIQVQWFGRRSNLHRVWDEDMITSYKMGYWELASNTKQLTKAQIKAIQTGSLTDWVAEVHQITKQVYASVKPGEELDYRYSYDYFSIVRDQLHIGGLRLAKILEDIFG